MNPRRIWMGVDCVNGFSLANLRNFLQFYLQNPSEKEIRYALRSELSWTHFRALIRIGDPKERAYYRDEAVVQRWTARELTRRNISEASAKSEFLR